MAWWLAKSEPATYSIDRFSVDGQTLWEGVRNYQARNYLRSMRRGDFVFIYHSNVPEPAIVGVGEVIAEAIPDPTQFEKGSPYFDEKATPDLPRWYAPTFQCQERWNVSVTRAMLLEHPTTAGMALLRKGLRLSVLPVSESEAEVISALAQP